VLHAEVSPALVPLRQLGEVYQELVQRARDSNLRPVVDEPSQVYQLPATFTTPVDGPMKIKVQIPLRPAVGARSFQLFRHDALPVAVNGSIFIPQFHEELLGVSTVDDTYLQIAEADLHSCQRLGETYLCDHQGTTFHGAGQSCAAAVFLNLPEQAKRNCYLEPFFNKEFIKRINSTSFISFMAQRTTATLQCGPDTSSYVLHGLQVGTLQGGCHLSCAGISISTPHQRSLQADTIIKLFPPSKESLAVIMLPTIPLLQQTEIIATPLMWNTTHLRVAEDPLNTTVATVATFAESAWDWTQTTLQKLSDWLYTVLFITIAILISATACRCAPALTKCRKQAPAAVNESALKPEEEEDAILALQPEDGTIAALKVLEETLQLSFLDETTPSEAELERLKPEEEPANHTKHSM